MSMIKKNIIFILLISSLSLNATGKNPDLLNKACDKIFANFADDFLRIMEKYD
jgi:hypothetical protein